MSSTVRQSPGPQRLVRVTIEVVDRSTGTLYCVTRTGTDAESLKYTFDKAVTEMAAKISST